MLSEKKGRPVVTGFSKQDSKGALAHENYSKYEIKLLINLTQKSKSLH